MSGCQAFSHSTDHQPSYSCSASTARIASSGTSPAPISAGTGRSRGGTASFSWTYASHGATASYVVFGSSPDRHGCTKSQITPSPGLLVRASSRATSAPRGYESCVSTKIRTPRLAAGPAAASSRRTPRSSSPPSPFPPGNTRTPTAPRSAARSTYRTSSSTIWGSSPGAHTLTYDATASGASRASASTRRTSVRSVRVSPGCTGWPSPARNSTPLHPPAALTATTSSNPAPGIPNVDAASFTATGPNLCRRVVNFCAGKAPSWRRNPRLGEKPQGGTPPLPTQTRPKPRLGEKPQGGTPPRPTQTRPEPRLGGKVTGYGGRQSLAGGSRRVGRPGCSPPRASR